MGHERIGSLPRSKRWRDVVASMGEYSGSGGGGLARIARSVVHNVQERARSLPADEGVHASFAFLVGLAVASRSPNPTDDAPWEIKLPHEATPIELGICLREWVRSQGGRGEYSEIATQAATDALAQWIQRHPSTGQEDLFASDPDPYERWRETGSGGGFSELAHAYFSSFTKRSLDYFLDREASAVISTVEVRERFDADVARHADETAKIMRSYAAGWFNKHASGGPPSPKIVQRFLDYSFVKIREELLREREAG